MKKKTTAILLALMILTGCEAAPAPAPETTPDIEAIVQQSVDEALAQYEEAQKAKDAEIAALKAKLEELASQAEESPDDAEMPEESTPPEDEETPAPTSSQPEEPEPQPEPVVFTPSQTNAVPTGSYNGFDLKNLYPAYIWESLQSTEGDQNTDVTWEYEDEEESQNSSGFLREDDAWTVVQLINEERESYGLDALPVDNDLMELAAVRAVELWEDQYSHTRPDGTTVGVQRCGENIGRRYSAEEQVQSWMNSEGHRKNNLSERYHHIGAGCYQAANGNLYWVAVFSLD